MNHNHFPQQHFDQQHGGPFGAAGTYEQPYGNAFGASAPGFGIPSANPFESSPGFDAAASWAQPQEAYRPPVPAAHAGNHYGHGNSWGNPAPGFESPGFGAPSYANVPPANHTENGFGFGNTAGWGAPAQESYAPAWQMPAVEAQTGRMKAFVGRMKDMLGRGDGRMSPNAGPVEMAMALGNSLQHRYQEMDPHKKAIAQGIGRGALAGLQEGFDGRYRSSRTGKVKKVKLARDVVSGNGARVGTKLAFKAARGAVHGFSEVAQPMASERHALAGHAVGFAANRAQHHLNQWERRVV